MSSSTISSSSLRSAGRGAGAYVWDYFHSGWAFLIPYLVCYALYRWLGWPVNPGRPGPPCLLHAYWALHGLHAVLFAAALAYRAGALRGLPPSEDQRSPWMPWIVLMLVFAIPGAYLEWPSDPWEHARRIQYWATQETILDPLGRYKDLYFFNYSIATLMPSDLGLAAVAVLNALLLGWQFYRLGRAAHLDPRFAFAFALLNCVVLGNSAFAFFRYYSLSTSMFCQVGVVAFIRLLVTRFGPSHSFSWPVLGTSILKSAPVALALLFLIARSHVQGLAMCAMALAAAAAWRIVGEGRHWGRLLLLVVVANIAVLALWPRHPAVDTTLPSTGWFSPLLGFNPAPGSAAGLRILAILGLFGVLDLAAGAYLIRRNHPVGWLTIAPLVGLLQPMMAIPLANFILGSGEILIFQRLLLAAPVGLASIVTGLILAPALGRFRLPVGFTALTALLFAFAVTSPLPPFHNRLWNLLCVVPADHGLEPEQQRLAEVLPGARAPDSGMLMAPTPLAFLVDSAVPGKFPARERRDPMTPSEVLHQRQALVHSYGPTLGADPAPIRDWIAPSGDQPETGTASLISGGLAVAAARNPAGRRAEAFGRDLLAVDPGSNYWLEMTVRSLAPVPGRTLLATIWHDASRRPLPSFAPAPDGAGSPAGWSNGEYSYFGLIDEPAPSAPTTYRIALGPDGGAQIPATARYIRVGGRLNQGETAAAQVELSNVRFWPRRPGDLMAAGTFASHGRFIYVRALPLAFSPGSLAARLSGHWNPHQLNLDLAGAQEIDMTFRGSILRSWVGGTIDIFDTPPEKP